MSEAECTQINAHFRAGTSNRVIEKLIGRDEKTIRNYLKRGKASSAAKRTGRRPKIVGRDARHLVRMAIVKNLSATEIASLFTYRPNKSTVLRVLRSNRFIRFATRKLT